MSSETIEFFAEIWRQQPSLIVFLVLGAAVFVWLVLDSHRLHRQRQARQRTGLY